jgi:hypothetical protein
MVETKLNIVSTSTAELPDPLDICNLRLSQNYIETAPVKKLLVTVPVRKPKQQEFVRVHPSEAYRVDVPMIDLKEEGELYVVHRDLAAELACEIVPMTLYTAITRQGVLFLWPVRLPDPDGRQMEWHRSMREAAEIGIERWVRVKANRLLGGYDVIVAEGVMAEPDWPKEINFQDMIRIAFRDGRLVDTPDHPLIKRLKGR